MRYCTTVLLMQVEVMYSGPVVIMFLTWYTNEGKKNETEVPHSAARS